MRVKRQRVCTTRRQELLPHSLAENRQSAIRTVDMKPEVLFLTEIRKCIKGVHCARGNSPRRADNTERAEAGMSILGHCILQQVHSDSELLVTRDVTDMIQAKSQNDGSLIDTAVCLLRHVEYQWGRSSLDSFVSRNAPQARIASNR